MQDEMAVIDAFEALRIEVATSTSLADMVVAGTPLNVKRRALLDEAAARRLLSEVHHSEGALLVVADRVTRSAREVLVGSGAGYLDLRGHLALRVPGLVIDAEVPPLVARSARKHPLSGTVGLEVATSLLMRPEQTGSVREIARMIERSPSTVSEILVGLQERELIDGARTVMGDRLFWEVAELWPIERTFLRELPPLHPTDPAARALRIGHDVGPNSIGWALTDSAAALAYDAPVALRSDYLVDFYVPDKQTAGRAATLLGTPHRTADSRCAVRVAPVPSICRDRVDPLSMQSTWPLAHPLFVALDLAQDSGRGREILAGWDPGPRWARVW